MGVLGDVARSYTYPIEKIHRLLHYVSSMPLGEGMDMLKKMQSIMKYCPEVLRTPVRRSSQTLIKKGRMAFLASLSKL